MSENKRLTKEIAKVEKLKEEKKFLELKFKENEDFK